MITRTSHSVVAISLALVTGILLGGCQTAPRLLQDETTIDPLFEQVDLVDIAILKPGVKASKKGMLAREARRECRKVLINSKMYSVPADAFVDEQLRARTLAPSQSAGVLGSDGVLEVVITDWDSRNLIPKGHVFVAGELTLYGTGKTLWKRKFRDKKCLAPKQVTSANRYEAETEIMRALVRDLLSKLPRKKTR